MNEQPPYHAVTTFLHHDGEIRVQHVWIDPTTRRVVSEHLTAPPPVESGPWSWEEVLLLASMELLERRVAAEAAVPW